MGKIADAVRQMRGQSLAAIVAEIERLEDEPSADDFAFWYAEYPHKVGRADAAKAYKAARKLASLDDLIAGLRRYIATKRPDAPYCNPGTWLRQQRWLDQPADAQRAPKGADFFDQFGSFADERAGHGGSEPRNRFDAPRVAERHFGDGAGDGSLVPFVRR